MYRRRTLILYVAVPAAIAFMNGVRGSMWAPNIGALRSILMFLTCGILVSAASAMTLQMLLMSARKLHLPNFAALIASAIVGVPLSYYVATFFILAFGQHFPGLPSALEPGTVGMVGGLGAYVVGPSGLLFFTIWLGSHALYEVTTGDVLYFEGVLKVDPVLEDVTAPPVIVTPQTPSVSTFLQKLKPNIGKILALEAQEHYVKVYADNGDDIVLYRFGDAVHELASLNGLQVHRSFWVAEDAVTDIRPSGKTYKLTLRNGVEVPVSLSYRGALQQHRLMTGMQPDATARAPAAMQVARAS